MDQIYSLFYNETQFIINKDNSEIFSFLGAIFGNHLLLTYSNRARSSTQTFSLDLDLLSSYNQHQLQSLLNFTIDINNIQYEFNSSFISLVSNTIFKHIQDNSSTNILKLQLANVNENEIKDFLKEINKYLTGQRISFSSFSISTTNNLIISLGLTDFILFLQLNYPDPTNPSEGMVFLKTSFLSILKTQYQKAIKLVSSNFDQFSENDLIQLNIETLNSVLSCSQFRTKNETILLSMINKLIENDKKYLTLLKHIRFCFVDFEVLSIFLSNLDIIDIDYELFDLIIQNIKQPKEKLYSSTRWTDNIKFISHQDYEQILNIIETLFISLEHIPDKFRGFYSST
jgi:hypothetical protein